MRDLLEQTQLYKNICLLMANGMTIKEMSRQLGWSERKITKIIAEMKVWTGCKNHKQIVGMMMRKGWIK